MRPAPLFGLAFVDQIRHASAVRRRTTVATDWPIGPLIVDCDLPGQVQSPSA